ncbi:hypothetical protein [Parafrankia sp. EUN1f]|uniref:hypothetical protein n=1 Tax=Parafrankia sp. EUN1f TaxID=102897 RepID=UPI0001C4439F|nr:hypothetical protein [Parafrankia sp. EUN1f]EFC82504.1 hypothetical protein FrEUN1fDRAFT_4370 [Parafrankia sp. EUN1f]
MRPRAAVVVAALFFTLLSVVLTSPAHASGTCSGAASLPGWSVTVSKNPRSWSGNPVLDAGIQVQVLQNTSTGTKMIRFRNISAVPRSPVNGSAYATPGGNEYGQTSTIVAGPDGGWCSDEAPANTTIYGFLGYGNLFAGVSG